MWNYLPDAERVSAELKEMKISDIELVPEGKGIFDVEIDEKLIFSKFQSGRFPDRGEIPGLISNQDFIKGIVNSPDASCWWNLKGFWIYPDCSTNLIVDDASLIHHIKNDQDHSASWVSRLISVNFPGPNFF